MCRDNKWEFKFCGQCYWQLFLDSRGVMMCAGITWFLTFLTPLFPPHIVCFHNPLSFFFAVCHHYLTVPRPNHLSNISSCNYTGLLCYLQENENDE